MRGLVDLAVRRRVSVTMTTLAVVAFGIVGYLRLPLELFPDIAYPSITVQTEFPDTAPQEVENLVTRRVEEAVGVLRGLEMIHSVSRSGTSEVTLEFDWGSDMDLLSMEVREKLDRLILPEETEKPIVLRFDPSLDPIIRLALHGGDLASMRYHAERRLKQEFETIDGVAAAQIKGGYEEEIHVHVHQERLAALGIPIDRVREIVGISNVNLPGGALRGEESQFLIRTLNEFDTVEEIGELIVQRSPDGGEVRLREVADVRRGYKEREEITRVQGHESVEISIYKEGDANTVTVARSVLERVEDARRKLPLGQSCDVLFDQSSFIQQAVDEVRDAAIIGGALAILVLFAFLRDLRSTIIIATSIPVSIIATFMAMYRMDISLNIMSLGGLTLGVGMLVDNAIVVLEAVYRKRQEGLGLARAAVLGTSEVGAAVFASTLTTIAVFVPIVFVEGIAGQLFRDQALTVSISLLVSLLTALTLIPMLCGLGRERPVAEVAAAAAVAAGSSAAAPTLGRFSRLYDRFLRGALRWRWCTLALALALFGGSVASLRWLGTELIPALSEGEFFFEVDMPEGTALAATSRIIERMEETAAKEPAIERTYGTVGSRLVAGGISLSTRAENLGQLNVVLRDRADRAAEERISASLRDVYRDIPDLDVKLGRPSYFSMRTPVEVVLFGEDLDDLREHSLEVAGALAAVPGLVDVRSSLEAGNPELRVVFDRARLASLGLDMARLSETLRSRVLGVVPTRFKEDDRQIDIRLRNLEMHRASVEDVRRLMLTGPGGEPIRLLTVADVTEARGPAEIHRLKQQRAAIVSGNLEGRTLGSVMRDVSRIVGELQAPPGVSVEIGGQNREMESSFASLRFALTLAVFLVYLVMAATFESFLHPLLVLFTIPLSLIGVAAGLLATSTPVSVIVLIGAVLLCGIVVNNAIVLIDAINRLRRAGVEKADAVIRAAHLRLRPILMTTLTTILGLLPMALAWGEGAELRAPLAITVASGLAVSTLLTLVVIPAAYFAVPSRVAVEAPDEANDAGGTTA